MKQNKKVAEMPVQAAGPWLGRACCQSAGRAGPREESAGRVRKPLGAADSEQRPEEKRAGRRMQAGPRRCQRRKRTRKEDSCERAQGISSHSSRARAQGATGGKTARDQLRGKRGPITKEIVCHHRERAVCWGQRARCEPAQAAATAAERREGRPRPAEQGAATGTQADRQMGKGRVQGGGGTAG